MDLVDKKKFSDGCCASGIIRWNVDITNTIASNLFKGNLRKIELTEKKN